MGCIGGSAQGDDRRVVLDQHKVGQILRRRGRGSLDHLAHQALLERYIPGREFTVGVLDNSALPVIELKHSHGFFDYEAKYQDNETKRDVQPDLPRELYEKLQEMAVAAHRALGCRHLSRVDIMLEADGCPYVLEVNTIPGFTDHSLFPLAARSAGIEFPDLCERIMELALAPVNAAQLPV